MPNVQYTEEQLTPWLSGTVLPTLSGRYQVRLRNPLKIMTGVFSNGRWRLEEGLTVHPPVRPSGQLEWRGLNFEPKHEPQTSTSSFELVFDWRVLGRETRA